MYTIKNYSTWLAENEESFGGLSEEPTNKEESPEYIEEYLNRETGENFVVVSAAGIGGEDDLFAICQDQEHKEKYEAGDEAAAEFIIYKPFEDGAESELSNYGFTYAEEDEEGNRTTEEYDETFDSLEECLEAIVTYIKSGDEKTETGEEFGPEEEPTEPESFKEEPEGYGDAGLLKSQLDAKKKEAEDKKTKYLSLEKGSPDRETLAKEMIELNREIMQLEKQLQKKTNVDLEDEEDFQDVYEKKKNKLKGEKVKSYKDWAKDSKKEKKEDKKAK